MAADRQLRIVKEINYKRLHEGTFDADNELTPVKESVYNKSSSTSRNGASDTGACTLEPRQSPVRAASDDLGSGDDDTSDDEETIAIRCEIEELKKRKKARLRLCKKEKLIAELAELRVTSSGETRRQSEHSHRPNDVNLKELRSLKTLEKKAEAKVSKILEIDIDSDDCSSESSVSDEEPQVQVKAKSKRKAGKSKKSGIFDHPPDQVKFKQAWPQSILQFEYAGSKIEFDQLEFNLFVAGELEIVTSPNVGQIEKKGRLNLLKKIAYYTETYEWEGIKKLYTHIIRQIENGVRTWADDFGNMELPLLIRYVKPESSAISAKLKENPSGYKVGKRGNEISYFCPFYQKNKCSFNSSHTGKFKGVSRYLLHICATCLRQEGKKLAHPECSSACVHQSG